MGGKTGWGFQPQQQQLFVDAVHGNDGGGNDGSLGRPFRTLHKAQLAARALRKQVQGAPAPHPHPHQVTVINLRGSGVFYLSSPLLLTPQDSFTTWQSYPGEHAVVSGI